MPKPRRFKAWSEELRHAGGERVCNLRTLSHTSDRAAVRRRRKKVRPTPPNLDSGRRSGRPRSLPRLRRYQEMPASAFAASSPFESDEAEAHALYIAMDNRRSFQFAQAMARRYAQGTNCRVSPAYLDLHSRKGKNVRHTTTTVETKADRPTDAG